MLGTIAFAVPFERFAAAAVWVWRTREAAVVDVALAAPLSIGQRPRAIRIGPALGTLTSSGKVLF